MRQVAIVITWAAFLVACGAPQTPQRGDDEAIGLVRRDYSDPQRQSWSGQSARPLVTSVWYPAPEDTVMEEIVIPPDRPVFVGGFAARNVEIGGSDRLPLILISHGTGGSGMQMMWLGRALAERGYIAAAVDHHGNTAAEDSFDPRGFRMPWQRALDLSRVIDALMADPMIGPRIDASRIGAAGFSLGGYTVAALAGGRIDLQVWRQFCASAERDATCDPQSEYPEAERDFNRLLQTDPATASLQLEHNAPYTDVRIKSFVALAPAFTQALDKSSLSAISVPFLVIAGEDDVVAPANTNAAYLSGLISGADLKMIPDATHYMFLNPCNSRGRRHVPVCADPEGVDRANIHVQAVDLIAEHFQRTLSATAATQPGK